MLSSLLQKPFNPNHRDLTSSPEPSEFPETLHPEYGALRPPSRHIPQRKSFLAVSTESQWPPCINPIPCEASVRKPLFISLSNTCEPAGFVNMILCKALRVLLSPASLTPKLSLHPRPQQCPRTRRSPLSLPHNPPSYPFVLNVFPMFGI